MDITAGVEAALNYALALLQSPSYKCLVKDPTAKIERKVYETLKELRDQGLSPSYVKNAKHFTANWY